eukprot:765419-Hanusia_phi.AAC.1
MSLLICRYQTTRPSPSPFTPPLARRRAEHTQFDGLRQDIQDIAGQRVSASVVTPSAAVESQDPELTANNST